MNLPVLRQSTYETMACPHSYGLVHIEGQRMPDSTNSDRGQDVHAVLATYAEHCARRKMKADYAYFDSIMLGAGEEACAILDVTRESLTIDYDNFFAAEAALWLDEDFQPTLAPADLPRHLNSNPNSLLITEGIEPSGKPAAYGGILDTIYLYPGGIIAASDDYKTHPQAFKPTTFQGKFYALLLMRHLPHLEKVEMRYRFVRYPNVIETATFTRDDIPMLAEDARRVRARQRDYHLLYAEEGIDSLKALSGTHCQYCPALSDFSCPIAKLNPAMNLSPEERLRYRLWHNAANRTNNKAMSEYVQGLEQTIRAVDANGRAYLFGPTEKEKTTFPLFVFEDGSFSTPIIDALADWAHTDPKDVAPTAKTPDPWLTKLRIGSTELKSKLKAKKRTILDQAIKDLAITETKIEMRVSRDAEVDDGTGEEYREFTQDDPFGENVGATPYEF